MLRREATLLLLLATSMWLLVDASHLRVMRRVELATKCNESVAIVLAVPIRSAKAKTSDPIASNVIVGGCGIIGGAGVLVNTSSDLGETTSADNLLLKEAMTGMYHEASDGVMFVAGPPRDPVQPLVVSGNPNLLLITNEGKLKLSIPLETALVVPDVSNRMFLFGRGRVEVIRKDLLTPLSSNTSIITVNATYAVAIQNRLFVLGKEWGVLVIACYNTTNATTEMEKNSTTPAMSLMKITHIMELRMFTAPPVLTQDGSAVLVIGTDWNGEGLLLRYSSRTLQLQNQQWLPMHPGATCLRSLRAGVVVGGPKYITLLTEQLQQLDCIPIPQEAGRMANCVPDVTGESIFSAHLGKTLWIFRTDIL